MAHARQAACTALSSMHRTEDKFSPIQTFPNAHRRSMRNRPAQHVLERRCRRSTRPGPTSWHPPAHPQRIQDLHNTFCNFSISSERPEANAPRAYAHLYAAAPQVLRGKHAYRPVSLPLASSSTRKGRPAGSRRAHEWSLRLTWASAAGEGPSSERGRQAMKGSSAGSEASADPKQACLQPSHDRSWQQAPWSLLCNQSYNPARPLSMSFTGQARSPGKHVKPSEHVNNTAGATAGAAARPCAHPRPPTRPGTRGRM